VKELLQEPEEIVRVARPISGVVVGGALESVSVLVRGQGIQRLSSMLFPGSLSCALLTSSGRCDEPLVPASGGFRDSHRQQTLSDKRKDVVLHRVVSGLDAKEASDLLSGSRGSILIKPFKLM